jgi:hypothetical protein
MLTVVYCTRKSNPDHTNHIIKSSGLHNKIQVIEIVNNGESLTKSYNRGLAQATYETVVFCHDDIIIETKQWGHKLLKLFDNNPEFGIIGVAGTKNMPVSGRWWENPKKMYGRVQHTHEGKTWLSTYSPDLGSELESVVICDGLFFAVNTKRIKSLFDETVEGFHFYDVDFCFANYLKGVKIGVTTLIRINHMSIGMTNDAWEANRKAFSIKYEDELPITIQRTIRKNEKLKVLIGCLYFSNFTGSELYVYELAKELIKQGCEVSVASTIGEPMASLAHRAGIKMYSIQEPPGYKLGDGKWGLKNPQTGQVEVTKENTLYKITNETFDVIHCNHKPITEHLLRLYPDTDTLCTIHSEVISLEEPVLSNQIKKYIAIRPEIKDFLVNNFQINEDRISVIYNPINYEKFKIVNKPQNKKKKILFVGTIDYLRKNAIQDLIDTTEKNGDELIIVGKKNDTYLDEMISGKSHVTYNEPTFHIEKYVQECDETAGILLGRTTIEGWLCGKKGWIYNVDNAGNILSKELHDVPSDVDKFRSDNVAKKIIEEYKSILS